MVVVIEPAMDVQFGRRAVRVVDFEEVRDALRKIVEHAHPSQADHSGSIFCHEYLLSLWR